MGTKHVGIESALSQNSFLVKLSGSTHMLITYAYES